MSKKAIILGATGLTGSILLDKLLHDAAYDEIKVFVRKSTGTNHPKLTEYVIDVLQLDQYAKDFVADVVFCCIGTTAKKTPDKKLYRKIDFGIPTTAAQLAMQNNINTFLVISSLGADPKSRVFYSRTKGEMEQQVREMGIPHTYILQPSFITGDRKENRLGEKIGIVLFKILAIALIGGLRKYRAIEAKTIAEAMLYLAYDLPVDKEVIMSDEIQLLGE